MKFYIADAFTESLFGGNPAGVVILRDTEDFPSEEVMRKTAAELRYSETVFVKPLEDHVFQLRYFTPADEVELCGHATIAAFTCLLDAGLLAANSSCLCKTLAGDLQIQADAHRVLMEMATPQLLQTIEDPQQRKELYATMGLEDPPVFAKDCKGISRTLLPMIISTGLPDILLPVSSRRQLTAIDPDFSRLTHLSQQYDVVGVHAFALEDPDNAAPCGASQQSHRMHVDAYCRNFAPLYGIDEEAATGTASGALTYYLLKNGLAGSSNLDSIPTGSGTADSGATDNNTAGSGAAGCAGTREFTFLQGESMGRPSQITCQLEQGNSPVIRVGGSAAILAKGEILEFLTYAS